MSHHTCDCGFEWIHGQSGKHLCGPHYRKQVAQLRASNRALESLLANAKTPPEPDFKATAPEVVMVLDDEKEVIFGVIAVAWSITLMLISFGVGVAVGMNQ